MKIQWQAALGIQTEKNPPPNMEFWKPPTSIFSFWSSAAEAAACKCAAAGLRPAVNGVPDQS